VSVDRTGWAAVRVHQDGVETALDTELTEHLGHEHGERPLGSTVRNGMRAKTVLTESGRCRSRFRGVGTGRSSR
jgi:transposase-like protein